MKCCHTGLVFCSAISCSVSSNTELPVDACLEIMPDRRMQQSASADADTHKKCKNRPSAHWNHFAYKSCPYDSCVCCCCSVKLTIKHSPSVLVFLLWYVRNIRWEEHIFFGWDSLHTKCVFGLEGTVHPKMQIHSLSINSHALVARPCAKGVNNIFSNQFEISRLLETWIKLEPFMFFPPLQCHFGSRHFFVEYKTAANFPSAWGWVANDWIYMYG